MNPEVFTQILLGFFGHFRRLQTFDEHFSLTILALSTHFVKLC
jgi:hypothetical protein